MKKILAIIILTLFLLSGVVEFVDANVRVRGHFRRDGSWVAPHFRSSPNRNRWDNWSTRDNFNPFTGREGRLDPFRNRW